MKTAAKRIVALALTLVMMICAFSISAFAATAKTTTAKKTTVKRTMVYTIVGDSIAAGHSLPGYRDGRPTDTFWPRQKGSYTDIVGKEINSTSFYNHAKSGLTSSDVRMLLDSSYKGNGLVSGFLPTTADGNYDYAAIKKLGTSMKTYIKKANVITIGVGFNDSWIPLLCAAKEVNDGKLRSAPNMQKQVDELRKQGTLATAAYDASRITKILATVSGNPAYFAALARYEAQADADFNANMPEIIRIVSELNPKAKIVVVGYYNPFANWKAAGINYGKFFQYRYTNMNNLVKAECKSRANCYFADVGQPELLTEEFQKYFWCFDAHPTAAGYQQMASAIIAALPASVFKA